MKYLLNNCCLFANTFRFINDWTVLHDGDESEKSFRKIFPRELELRSRMIANQKGIFYIWELKIKDNRFSLSFYNKRNDFPFSIFRMTYLRSNTSPKIFYSAFAAEILRIAKATSTYNESTTSCKALIKRAQNQDDKAVVLERTLSKYFACHFELFQQFNNTSITFINSLFG